MEGDTSVSVDSVDTSVEDSPEIIEDSVADHYESDDSDNQEAEADGTEISDDRKRPEAKPQPKPVAKDKKTEAQKKKELGEEDLDALVTLKVDGKEKKMTLREAKARLQKAEAAEKRLQEGSEAIKRARAFEEWAQKNPEAFLKRKGIDPVQFAAKIIDEHIKWQELSEPERKALQYEQELNAFKREKQQREEMQRRQEIESRNRQQFESVQKQLDTQILEAFKGSGLPQGEKFYVERMAAVMLGAAHRNEELSPSQAADIVKRKTLGDFRRLADTMDAKAIREWLGDQNLKKLLEAEVQRVTGKTAPTPNSGSRPGQAPAPTNKRQSNKPLSEREWEKHMESLRTA